MKDLKGALVGLLLVLFCTFFAVAAKSQTTYYQLYDGKTQDFHMTVNDSTIDITMDSIRYHVVIDSTSTDFFGFKTYVPDSVNYYGTFVVFSDYIGVTYSNGFVEFRIIPSTENSLCDKENLQ